MTLTHVSTKALLDGLTALLGTERSTLARLIAHLVEVEDRRALLDAACSSLFEFCVRKLGLSEGEAFRRINAARLVRRFPIILGMIEAGQIHLSALVMLRDHLDDANHARLLAEASGKSKREVQELIAAHFPRPDVPTVVRKLPVRSPVASTASAAPAERMAAPSQAPEPNVLALADTPCPTHAVAALDLPPARRSNHTNEARPSTRAGSVEPLSSDRYKVQVTASAQLKAKLERAAQLLGHRNAEADLAHVIERALDLLIPSLEKQRFGATAREHAPRKSRPATPGRVTHATRREVVARDGEQCSFVSADGERCPARTHLEFDHRWPRARGGADDASNIRLLCRQHNHHAAERIFGRRHIATAIALRRSMQRSPERTAATAQED